MRLRTIEFTKDTFTEVDGEKVQQRAKGDKLRVDPVSAVSFVEKKKVAKYVDDDKPASEPAAPAPGAN